MSKIMMFYKERNIELLLGPSPSHRLSPFVVQKSKCHVPPGPACQVFGYPVEVFSFCLLVCTCVIGEPTDGLLCFHLAAEFFRLTCSAYCYIVPSQ